MNKFLKIIFLLLLPVLSVAQQNPVDSLKKIYLKSTDDSILYKTSNELYDYYGELNRDSALVFAGQCVLISRRNNKKLNEGYSLSRKAYQELNLGLLAEALHSLMNAFSICQDKNNENSFWDIEPLRSEKSKRLFALSCTHHIYALLMRLTLNSEQELLHFKEAKRIAVEINSLPRSLLGSLNLGRMYLEKGKFDSAMLFENEAEKISISSGYEKYLTTIYLYQGIIYMNTGDTSSALLHLYKGIQSGAQQGNLDGLVRCYHELTDYYFARRNKDSSLYYGIKQLETFRKLRAASVFEYHIGTVYKSLSSVYQMWGAVDSSFKYLALAEAANDSLKTNRIKSLAEFQTLTLNEQQRLQTIEKEKVIYQNKVRTWFLLAGIAVLLLLSTIFYRNNRQKQKAKIKIEKAYEHLKSTQQQLVQSEKMASLGELTAGIAHEIQNPLNFVNNFSEVNKELLVEMKDELDKGNMKDAKAIADDVIVNEEKINHHGKRADAIVKGMLQHSRSSNGVKEPTDINALADEYLRLAYHGLRAKDKSFSAILKTDFDETIGNINIIPQDIGRVILNLITNAFYAVDEKRKLHLNGAPAEASAKADSPGVKVWKDKFEPTVSVSTKKVNDKVEVKVKDNGNGIPQKILDKIFQPFFTTKPTGEGTGLGLSLSYDIVKKGHAGDLEVVTRENEGSEFIIKLPI